MPDGFLHHYAPLRVSLVQTGVAQHIHGHGIEAGLRGEVEADFMGYLTGEFLDPSRNGPIQCGVFHIARDIVEALGKELPFLGVDLHILEEFPQLFPLFLTERFVGKLRARVADDEEGLGQAPIVEQAEQGWNQLSLGQVSACAEDHQNAGRNLPGP